MIEPVRRSVHLRCDPADAFRIFTEDIGTWWPLEKHSIAVDEHEDGNVQVERIEFQGRAGGQIIEHMSNGDSLPWGEVLVYEPPNRVVIAWKPNRRPAPPTELEVRFSRNGDGTSVELEHRGWERLGEEAERAREGYATGWPGVLDLFAAAAAAAPGA